MKMAKQKEELEVGKKKNKKKLAITIAKPTQTELLLQHIPMNGLGSLEDVQLICASATVGRTLRRQLMQLLGATSAEQAATLVTGEGDGWTRKGSSVENVERRKSVLMPGRLRTSSSRLFVMLRRRPYQ
jgi:hypothetical protein